MIYALITIVIALPANVVLLQKTLITVSSNVPTTRMSAWHYLMQPEITSLPLNTEILFGNNSLTVQENTSIFIAVQTYIINTGRFAAV